MKALFRLSFIRAWLLSAMLFLPAGAAQAAETNEEQQPYHLIRTLHVVQDQTAYGLQASLALQNSLIKRIEQQLLVVPDEVWQDPRNARAAISFVLSGGSPVILRRLTNISPAPNISPDLMKGVLAYIEGREQDALDALGKVNPHNIAPGLNGRIALMQSALFARTDSARALELLDLARLFLPGTLVDEGALRREIYLTGQMGLTDKFKALSRHYLHRYAQSVYVDDFYQRFTLTIPKLGIGGSEEEQVWLDELLTSLDPRLAQEIRLQVARNAVTEGKTAIADLSAQRILAAVAPDSVAAERARLYQAAVEVLKPEGFESGREALRAIDKSKLPRQDNALLDSALQMASYIRAWPPSRGGDNQAAASNGSTNSRTDAPAPEQGAARTTAAVEPSAAVVPATPPPAPVAPAGPVPPKAMAIENSVNNTLERTRSLLNDIDRILQDSFKNAGTQP